MAADQDVSWAGIAMLQPPRQVFEGKALKGRVEEDQTQWERVERPKLTDGWQVEPFAAAELHGAVCTIAMSKAPGNDGWLVSRMRQWPRTVLQYVATLFVAFEAAGRWPDELRGGVICLLPKGRVQATADTPLGARPVVLLPLLYRPWTWKRGRDIGGG